jgi:branched-chain amino acid transport system permease protein
MLSFTSFSDVYSPVWTFAPLMAVMIGGAGTIFGPIVGSFFLVILSQIFALTLGDAHLILFGILFILVVLYFPFGLVGSVDRIAPFFSSLARRFRKGNQQGLP